MKTDWLRKEDESEYAYIYRIGNIKEQIGSWQDVADLLNYQLGYQYTESKYRKDYAAFCKLFEANRDKLTDNSAQLHEIEQRELELRMEQRKFYDQRQALTRVVNAKAREESLHECITRSAEQLNMSKPLVPLSRAGEVHRLGTEALLILTDWHYGMVCDNPFNRYNPEVCAQRVRRLIDETVERLLMHQVTDLHIHLLGDFAHGAIHPTVRLESVENTCDQLMRVSEILAEAIHEISAAVDRVDVFATYGNHMRTVQNKKESIHSDNMEKIIPWWLATRLKDDDTINVCPMCEEFITDFIGGKTVVSTHGDLDTVRDFGVTANMLLSRDLGTPVDIAIMGDKHHAESLDRFGVDSMIAPALCGSDNHAHGKRLYAKPSQLLMTFEQDYGRDAVYYLKLEEN